MAAKKGRPLRTLAYTKTFKKDYQRMAAAGRYDMTLLTTPRQIGRAHV